MASYGDIRDAYQSIYEDTTDYVGTALDLLLESGIIDEEELELLEMRKQDKVAGVPKGGTSDLAMRSMKKLVKQMHGGQQKKKERGAKPKFAPQTPVDRIKVKLSQQRAQKPDPYKARPGESD